MGCLLSTLGAVKGLAMGNSGDWSSYTWQEGAEWWVRGQGFGWGSEQLTRLVAVGKG